MWRAILGDISIYRAEQKDQFSNRYISLWSLLAFQAGFINSIGFLACQRFVSHVTGFGSQIGVNIAKGQNFLALEMLSMPAAFVAGAYLNGWLTVARKARGLSPRYDIVTALIPLFLFCMLIAGNAGAFGPFGESLMFARDFIFLSTLSGVCGMQNACFATLTQGQIRTTHLTGISTDFGTDLALLFSGNLPDKERDMARRRNVLRFMTFASFSMGALISATVDTSLQYWSLAIPLGTSTFVAAIFRVVKYQTRERSERVKDRRSKIEEASAARSLAD